MNRIHRIVFNRAPGAFQVLSEQAKERGKRNATVCAGACVLALTALAPAYAQSVIIDDGKHEIVDGLDPAGGGPGTQPSPWTIGEELFVGEAGSNGELTVRNGGAVENRDGHVGRSGAVGVVTIAGEGSSWKNNRNLYVGNDGNGTVSILDGASVSADSIISIGLNGADARGAVTVSGAGSSMASGDRMSLGHVGTGTLTVEDGGLAAVSHVYMGGIPSSGFAGAGKLLLAGSDDRRGALATGFLEVGAGNGRINFDGGVLRATGDEADFLRNFRPGDVTFDTGGAFIDSNGHDIGIGADLQGTGGLTKLGEGALTLSGQNSYVGATTVQAGALRADTHGALVNNGAYVIHGGTLDLTGYDLTPGIDLVMSSLSGNGGTLDMGNAFVWVEQDVNTTFDGDIVGASSRLYKAGAGTLALNGQVGGLGYGVYAEGGILALNSANTYAGGTYIYDAVVEIGHDQALSAGSVSVYSDHSVLRAGADVTLANQIIFSAPLESMLTIDGSHNLTLTGNIREPHPLWPSGIAKSGGGTLSLSGQGNYRGTTTVQAGTLIVDGSIASSSLVTVRYGATLGGSGTVGNTTVEDGGILAPGGSAAGLFTVDGNLALSSGSILEYRLGAPGTAGDPAGGRSGRLAVTGDLQLDGILNLAQSADSSDGTAGLGYYRLMTYGGELTGNGLEIGGVPHPDASLYEIQAGGGNVDLFVPAPGMPGDDTLQHWQGGDGAWDTGNRRWLNRNGDMPVAWAGNHAVFKNEPGGFNGGVIDVVGIQRFAGLQFVGEGYRLQGAGSLETIAGGSEIRVLADRAEIAAEISGSGGIAKTEAGTLILSGTNTYTGGTTLAGGTLSVASDVNLGHEQGALIFDGGVLQVAGPDFNGTEREIAWGVRGGGFDIADQANNFHLDRNIAGQGDLVKRGDGTLTLAGRNAYGNTRVEGGRLLGDADSISGNIANAGVVAFVQNADASFAGDISGLGDANGTMIKDGAAALTLKGRSVLDWSVASGTVITEASRFAGDVRLEGAASGLTFTDTGNAIYGGKVSGIGRFALEGAGTVVLTGDSSGFAGTTTLSGGKLRVGDADGKGALGGSLDVLAGATLGGSGTVGSGAGSKVTINPGGVLAPGNSVGTLTVDGDLAFETGSRFEVEVNPQGADSDRVAVTGNAALNGGSVVHVGAAGRYDLRSTYTILSAGGALSGAFDDVTSDFAFLAPSLHYDYGSGTVDLEFSRNGRGFASAALTRNQIATAGGIDSIGWDAAHPVYDAIVRSPDDSRFLRASFDALSGEIHASAKSALIEDSRFIRNAANDRVRAAFAAPGASNAPVLSYGSRETPTQVSADHNGPVVWSHAFGSWGSTDSGGNAAALDRNTGGMLIGADRLAGDWRIGVLAGYSHSDLKVRRLSSSGSSDNYHLGLYGGTRWGGVSLRAGAAYSWHRIDTRRSVAVPGLAGRLAAGYHAGTFQAFGELGRSIDMGAIRLEPYANLAYVGFRTEGFNETGGAAALSSPGQNTDVTFATLGLRADSEVSFGAVEATLRGMVGWRHAFGDIKPEALLGFSAGNAFSIAGAPIARDSAVIEAGLDLRLTPSATLAFSYAGQLSGSTRDHGVKANLAIRF